VPGIERSLESGQQSFGARAIMAVAAQFLDEGALLRDPRFALGNVTIGSYQIGSFPGDAGTIDGTGVTAPRRVARPHPVHQRRAQGLGELGAGRAKEAPMLGEHLAMARGGLFGGAAQLGRLPHQALEARGFILRFHAGRMPEPSGRWL
jgi:hypothetical protein